MRITLMIVMLCLACSAETKFKMYMSDQNKDTLKIFEGDSIPRYNWNHCKGYWMRANDTAAILVDDTYDVKKRMIFRLFEYGDCLYLKQLDPEESNTYL